ncbi:MAG: response regulator [Fusobacteriaceae bacterium]|nr:response regulator [Fusobacteriaceae bacterium]MBN2837801.1 response regulator [Fusobacteriaceae bacterium]
MGKKSVIIVDDSCFTRRVINKFLEEDFVIIGEAKDGVEAIEIYKKLKPEIITIDLIMEKMDGLTAAKEILEFDKNAKIVLISSMGQKNYVDNSIKIGVKDFLVKPFSREKLLKVLRDVSNNE